ncbi:MAG: hypothetical protein FGM15_10250 [Chthoniobacterales bacterium]|nr:hypothetical protein [Chthoniobacterales bacterium]
MIFDDVSEPSRPDPDRGSSRRRPGDARQRNSSRRRRRRSSSFEDAARFDEPLRESPDRNTSAWLWVLALLALVALGFGAFLHHQRSAPAPLAGEAPSNQLMPFIDPILAPLETGTTGYSAETLSGLQSQFRIEGDKVNLDSRDIYSTAATIAQILGEALQDRTRHMERLVKLGAPVEGIAPDSAARTDVSETQRKHLELAVGISWQRNSGTYRNRLEELWYRLLRLEQGRFRAGSAPLSMLPENPTMTPANE